MHSTHCLIICTACNFIHSTRFASLPAIICRGRTICFVAIYPVLSRFWMEKLSQKCCDWKAVHWNVPKYLLQTLGKGVTCISDHNARKVTSLLRRPPFIEGPSSLFCNALWCPGHRIHCRCRSCDTGQDSCAIYMKCHPTHSKQGTPHTFTIQCIAHCEDPVDPDI